MDLSHGDTRDRKRKGETDRQKSVRERERKRKLGEDEDEHLYRVEWYQKVEDKLTSFRNVNVAFNLTLIMIKILFDIF